MNIDSSQGQCRGGVGTMGNEDDRGEPFVLDFDNQVIPPLIRVRQWLATELVDVDDDHLSAVVLVCTELVTNVYEHATGPCRIRLQHNRVPCWVQVDVSDTSPDLPVQGRSQKGKLGGRGLLLIDKLSERWAAQSTQDGKTIWARISCEDPARGITRCLHAPR